MMRFVKSADRSIKIKVGACPSADGHEKDISKNGDIVASHGYWVREYLTYLKPWLHDQQIPLSSWIFMNWRNYILTNHSHDNRSIGTSLAHLLRPLLISTCLQIIIDKKATDSCLLNEVKCISIFYTNFVSTAVVTPVNFV
jgi:hypothetical protein